MDSRRADQLSVGHTLGGVQSFNNTVDFDAVNHRFWRMRESGGTTFFETSPDAGSWTTVHSLPTPSFVNNVAVNFGALVGNSGTLDGIVQFDNLNVVP